MWLFYHYLRSFEKVIICAGYPELFDDSVGADYGATEKGEKRDELLPNRQRILLSSLGGLLFRDLSFLGWQREEC